MELLVCELARIENAIANIREALQWRADEKRTAFDATDLAQAIQDNLQPDVVAIIAAKLQISIETDDETINEQYRWFADMLAKLVGGWDEALKTAIDYGIDE